jgi:RNA polymerase-binding transcription factor DksA
MITRSENDIRAVREKLLGRAAELRERVDRVHRDLARTREPLPRDSDDAAIVLENDEVLQAIEESSASELRDIERALERLDAGTFARCGKCGAEIDAERLSAVPHAMLCRQCAT